MMNPESPLLAQKAGPRTQIQVARAVDPELILLTQFNQSPGSGGAQPAGTEEPLADDRAYTAQGTGQRLCRPFLKVARRSGLVPGPALGFEQRDDGLHLVATFEEDSAKRLALGADVLPFDIRVTAVALRFGGQPEDVLAFGDPLQIPGAAPAAGAAFRIEADALVPEDDRRARLISSLKTRDGASWQVKMEFHWVKVVPAAGGGSTPPGKVKIFKPPHLEPLQAAAPLTKINLADAAAVSHQPAVAAQPLKVGAVREPTFVSVRPDVLREIVGRRRRVFPQPTTQVETLSLERDWPAWYPTETEENRAIFAAVDNDYAVAAWQSSAHGWYQPTPIQDTVYCLPDAYGLALDPVTGLPSIQAVLLRKNAGAAPADDLDPAAYITRLTLRAVPQFSPERLSSLRTLLRGESDHQLVYCDLVLGGYSAARFVADESLAGIGQLFAGASAGDQPTINPGEGFTLTYEGNTEFADLIFQRLKGEGIGGSVELDLRQPGNTVLKQRVPVRLTVRELTPLKLPLSLTAPAAPSDFELANPAARPVQVRGIEAYALRVSPVTGRVYEFFPAAAPEIAWPLHLGPGESRPLRLAVQPGDAVYNRWDVELLDALPEDTGALLLDQVFDAATGGVRGWKIEVSSPPLEFFDQLKPEEQAALAGVMALEVQIRRAGSASSEKVKLSRAQPRGQVLLSRTVADFLSDRATGRSAFEYRRRLLRLTSADPWGDTWQSESGSILTVYVT
ncbi:MAG TPA: hypothetical protein VGM86_18690 [Thermoanaerobaculia bacterium]|jgi:hypothetical protein